MTESSSMVGRVLRASTRGYACGTHSVQIGPQHDFGAFVKAPIANDSGIQAVGLIYKVEVKDDQLINELVMGEYVPNSVLMDQRNNRMVPVEVLVLNVGYMTADRSYVIHSLPPRPPMSLSDVVLCDREDVLYFTQQPDFFRLVLAAAEVPSDDLLGAALRYAAFAYADGEPRYSFLANCGRRLARELSGDLKRLAHILALLRP